MDIGFVTFYSPEIVAFAAGAGFDSLEVFVNRGSSLDLDRVSRDDLDRARDDILSHGLRVGTLRCSANHLVADRAQRVSNNAYFLKALKLCRDFGTTILTTNTWADASIAPAENLKIYKPVFTEYARAAESEGVLIAMENCPHGSWYPYTIGSIGYSPELWDALFDAVPSRSIGLELDPAHLFWLGIDIPRAIRSYRDRLFAFHAKDCEIDAEGRYRYGILGRQLGAASMWDTGWWRSRLPGLGQIDWKEVFRALFDIAYAGPLIIEHEDPVFGGDRSELGLTLGPKTQAGLRLGLRYLRGFLPDRD